MTNQELVTFLRDVADFYEQHEAANLPKPFWIYTEEVTVYLPANQAKEALRAIGSFAKDYEDDKFKAIKELPGGGKIVLKTDREAVCVAKVVGKRVVAEKVIPSSYTEEQVIPAHEEDIVEWDCEPILAERTESEP